MADKNDDAFHKYEDHSKAFALLFDSHQIEDKFKRITSLSYSIVRDKEEQRLCSMLEVSGEIGEEFIHTVKSAVSCVAIAKSEKEAIAMQLGIVKIIPSGMAICLTCLTKAIRLCEENLIILKDLQEATKKYATVE